MLTDGTKLLKRFEQLKSRRSVIEDDWRECFRYTYPLRGVGFESMGVVAANPGQQAASSARENQANLLDSTGTDAARTLAAALQSGLTPSNSRWPLLEVQNETDEERRWLDACADLVWVNIHAANFDAVAFDCMLDMVAAGMFPLFADEGPDGGLQFEEWSLANSYFAASRPGGPIDTVFNEFPLTVEQAVNTYGIEMVSDKVREQYRAEKLDEMVTFVRCVYPRPGPHGMLTKNLPIASYHVEAETKKIVRESGYHEQPIGVPRWNQIPGSAYGFGPVKEALPDLKTLNKEVESVLANMDLAVAGMWIAQDDGVLNPRSIKVGPRKVIVASSVDSMKALAPAAKFDAALVEIDRLQRSIRKVLLADQLEPQKKAGDQPTATEVMVRVELIRQLLGPIYGRMQSEYLQWLVKRCFGLAYRAGALPPAPRSMLEPGRVITVRYNSPIARAQKGADVAAMDRYEASLGAQAQAGMVDAFDVYEWDKARRHRAELLGVPQDLIPDTDVIDERRKQREQAQKAEQGLQTAERMHKIVRDDGGNIAGILPAIANAAK